MFTDTIAAISTPLAPGAISIVRLSGPDAIAIADKVFSGPVSSYAPNTIHYGMVKEGDVPIDEVLLSVFKGPKSYTAEDMVEINCHGGTQVPRAVLRLLLSSGARLARPGEFTERAFLHGRIDLTQSESVLDLINSENDQTAKLAVQGVKGAVRELIEPLEEDLLETIALLEVNIDYPEYEDIEQLTETKLLPRISDWIHRVDEILARAQNGQQVRHGIDTVILGKPNVGKSSLLNALLEEEKAIVTDIPGTTRDVVEGRIQLDGIQLNLIDTAGIHKSSDVVEQIGIEKSLDALEKADLVILVLEAGKEPDAEEQKLLEATEAKNRILVWNKDDLAEVPGLSISAKNAKVQPLLDEIKARFENGLPEKAPVLSNERQIGLLKSARNSMISAEQALKQGVELDLVEIDLSQARESLKEIVGKASREDLLDTLFSKFCVGK